MCRSIELHIGASRIGRYTHCGKLRRERGRGGFRTLMAVYEGGSGVHVFTGHWVVDDSDLMDVGKSMRD